MAKTTAKAGAKPPGSKKSNKPAPASRTTVPPKGLTELFISCIKEMYWVENYLILQVLPKVQQASGSAALRKAVGDHFKITKGHVARLEEIFRLLGLAPQAKKSDGLEGLAIEGEGIINSTAPGSPARDSGLIMACQKVETYEITAYKGIALLATRLSKPEIAGLLQQTIAEEQEAEDLLTSLAEKE